MLFRSKDGNKRTAMDVRVNDIALQGGKREAAQPAKKESYTPSDMDFANDSDPIPF